MNQKQKIDSLQSEVKKYQDKLKQIHSDWSETKEGSRYGNEYLEVQTKVYQSMISDLQSEIDKLKRKKG